LLAEDHSKQGRQASENSMEPEVRAVFGKPGRGEYPRSVRQADRYRRTFTDGIDHQPVRLDFPAEMSRAWAEFWNASAMVGTRVHTSS
jgi:hypothetical protein